MKLLHRWPDAKLHGSVEVREVKFQTLRGNPLKDPYERSIVIYLPPNYHKTTQSYPWIIALSGFFGTSLGFINSDPLSLNLIEQADLLIRQGLPPFVIAIPDGFTRYGGSQYLNSTATGNYEDMIVQEFIPWIESLYRVSKKRGIMGKSSGGYGSLMLSWRNPGLFQAVACHSGDMYFELCYKHDFPVAAQILGEHKTVARFLASLKGKHKYSHSETVTLSVIAMASCYSPTRDGSFELPFDLHTAKLREEVWRKWLQHDPVILVDKTWKPWKRLKTLYLDCGNKDEYYLHFGARIFTEKLKSHKIRHYYEEFDDGHRSINYRYSLSLPRIVKGIC